MYVRTDSLDDEIRITVDAAVELANVLAGKPTGDAVDLSLSAALRQVLIDHEFLRARRAGDAELDEVAGALAPVGALVTALPETQLSEAVKRVNRLLDDCKVVPSLSGHDDFPLHIHWTSSTSSFAHQVVVDLLMALAQTLCDHGTERFGRCAADDCGRVFSDSTKNGSRRFCSDARCASRTHTAAHRARQKSD